MSGIRVTVKTDSREWDAAVALLAEVIHDKTADASLDAAELVGSFAKAKLTELSHGPLSFSPSPRGAGRPPARVSGALADSIVSVRSDGTSAQVGPTARYGRIQELGGRMEGNPRMKFTKRFSDGAIVRFEREIVVLTPRPYLAPATDDAVNSGRVREIYAQWWAEAIEQGV